MATHFQGSATAGFLRSKIAPVAGPTAQHIKSSPPCCSSCSRLQNFRNGWLCSCCALTRQITSARLAEMARTGKTTKRSSGGKMSTPSRNSKLLKNKPDNKVAAHAEAVRQMADPHFEQQLKLYEQAVQHFHQQKLAKAKELLEKVIVGPSKELADRAQVHLRITEQRMAKQAAPSLRTPEEHYQEGVAMMNLGRWDEARDHLLRARK